ncbi:MAG: SDR family NAD(P)-dependent oxidoreductase [Salinibacterium sp.]|nr:SDR family NAD(P)-dependent oxidoreductase [Salinibacterium sp.]
MSNLDGAVVLLIGSTGGLGSRIATQLEGLGANIVRSARADGDLRDVDGPARAVAAAITSYGRLDGLVIAAGVVAFGPIESVSDAAITELFATNTLGPIRLIREASPHLAASATAGREPFIVTLSGIVADAPTAGLSAYSAAKAGLAAFTKAANRELRKSGIRVLDARPGHTETALSRHPIEGIAPTFPAGLDPDAVAARIVRAIVDGEKDLPGTEFS